MELRREKKKLLSESNLRLLTSLTISLANKVDSTAEKCINPFTPNTAYVKGAYVTHDNYIYESKLACNDADWVESHWIRLSDTIEELTVDDVKSYLSLTQDQLDTLASIISTEVRLDKCFSSSDTYMRIQDALKEAKQYCITELAKKSTGSFKKANDVSEVTDGNYLYLIFNSGTSKYDIYALVDSKVELLTSVDVNLDDYFTKQEITDNYYDKSTSDGKFATITTVDSKVDQTDFDNHTADTVAHMTQELKDKLVTTDDVVDYVSNYADASLIPNMSLIKSTYFGSYVPSSTNRTDDPNETTLAIIRTKHANCPTDTMEYIIFTIIIDKRFGSNGGDVSFNNIAEKKQIAIATVNQNDIYVRSHAYNSTWTSWRRLCGTTVADVPATGITNFSSNYSSGSVSYMVRNGICYVSVVDLKLKSTGTDLLICNGMPIPALGFVDALAENRGITIGNIVIDATGKLKSPYVDSAKNLYCTFSYPVAES